MKRDLNREEEKTSTMKVRKTKKETALCLTSNKDREDFISSLKAGMEKILS